MQTKISALSIGIGAYTELPKLTCPPNDAKDFATVVHSGAMPSEIKLLTNSEATKKSVLKELAWLADSSRPTDTAILFFSGHGGRLNTQASLFPVDTQTRDLEKTCLTNRELTDALRAIKSSRLVAFLDTCHSGAVGDIEDETSVTESKLRAIGEGNGRFILSSSTPDAPALESSSMRNSIFTTYLLEALRGEVAQADGRIWASDVFSFVAHRMLRNHSQEIYQKAVGQNFVILTHDRPSSGPIPILDSSSADQRSLRLAMQSVYDRSELSRLCREMGIDIENLPGRTLENQLLDLIDLCHRHGLRHRLLEFLHADHPELFQSTKL